MQNSTFRRPFTIALFVLALTAWTIALCAPVDRSPTAKAIGGPERRFYVSKLIHIAGYATLTILAGLIPTHRRGRMILLGVLVLHTGSSEILQGFFERTPAIRDVGLDLIGITIAIVIRPKPWRVLRLRAHVNAQANSFDRT